VIDSDAVIDIFLGPGECYFGDAPTRIRTLLGSCVAVTMWHPQGRVGGMCHYLLPQRLIGTGGQLDGRYGDEALTYLAQQAADAGGHPAEYEVKLFGGSDMLSTRTSTKHMDIGARNVTLAKKLLAQLGFRIVVEHVGGTKHRSLVFEVWSGDVWLKRHHDQVSVGIRAARAQ
jgi:chemotaxis protein CheD